MTTLLLTSFVSRVWFLLLVATVTTTTVSIVDVVAFRSPASIGRIRSLIPRNCDNKEQPLSSAGCVSFRHFPLKSVGDEDDEDVVLAKNDLTMKDNDGDSDGGDKSIDHKKDKKVDALLDLLGAVPSNFPTPKSLTDDILIAVRNLEENCPTSAASVLSELSGNWELLWTAQDRSSEQYIKGGLANRIINPLENQSYANNPFRGLNPFQRGGGNGGGGGRANPVLPREIQDVLERTGILEPSGGTATTVAPIRSSQGIDIKRSRVRNVVNVQIKRPFPVKGSLIVDVDFKPNVEDKRRIDVKFDSFRFIFKNANVDRKFPLGVLGPTGWLRTGYIDDRIRITRGHKGSVFILSRTAKRKSS